MLTSYEPLKICMKRPRHKCREGRRSWHLSRPSRYNHHKVQNGDRSRQDSSDDKQHKWLPKRDQDKRSEARRSGELQVSWGQSRWLIKTRRIKTRDQTTVALSRLKIIWRDKNILLASKVKLMRTLILSTFFVPVRAGPWQQKWREGSKLLRWDFWTFPTKTMWRMRRLATESRMQLEYMMIS